MRQKSARGVCGLVCPDRFCMTMQDRNREELPLLTENYQGERTDYDDQI
jgi:hypothetical protein